jgi:DNA-binding transcriptional LysR family regulator
MQTFDLELLRSLSAIVAHDSFAAAAVHLGRTQSAVTQQMQRLEEQVGHSLFEKQGRQKRLTEHGQRVLVYARHLLAINDEAMRSLQEDQLEGVLRIGASDDVADTLLPPVLAEIARHSPLLQLDIRLGRSPFLMDQLQRGEIDMTISNRAEDRVEAVVLRSSPTVWLCASSYVHDLSKPIPLITTDGPSIFRRMSLEALDAAGIAWTPRTTTSSVMGIRAALRAGLGIAARGVEQIDSGLRVLGASDGMPALRDLVYWLYIRNNVINPVTSKVFENLRDRLRLPPVSIER